MWCWYVSYISNYILCCFLKGSVYFFLQNMQLIPALQGSADISGQTVGSCAGKESSLAWPLLYLDFALIFLFDSLPFFYTRCIKLIYLFTTILTHPGIRFPRFRGWFLLLISCMILGKLLSTLGFSCLSTKWGQ